MRPSPRRGKNRARSRGQALVEMAIAVPVIMLVALALFEGGAFAFSLTTLENAVQRGGRFAALPSTVNVADVQNLVATEASRGTVSVAAADVVVAVSGCASSPCTLAGKASGDRVRVTINYVYTPLTAVVFGGSATFGLTADTEFHVE